MRLPSTLCQFLFSQELRKHLYVPPTYHNICRLTNRVKQPCYPESAIKLDTGGQNPGTDVPINANPGTNCNDPGPLDGPYSLGNPFPIYVSATYCDNKDEWRIQYYNYYV